MTSLVYPQNFDNLKTAQFEEFDFGELSSWVIINILRMLHNLVFTMHTFIITLVNFFSISAS